MQKDIQYMEEYNILFNLSVFFWLIKSNLKDWVRRLQKPASHIKAK